MHFFIVPKMLLNPLKEIRNAIGNYQDNSFVSLQIAETYGIIKEPLLYLSQNLL